MARTPNRDNQYSFLPGEGGMLKDSRSKGSKNARTGRPRNRGKETAVIADRIRGAALEAMDELDMASMIKQSFMDDFLGTLQALARWKPAEVQLSGSVTLQDEFTEILRNASARERQHLDSDAQAGGAMAELPRDVRH